VEVIRVHRLSHFENGYLLAYAVAFRASIGRSKFMEVLLLFSRNATNWNLLLLAFTVYV
jgi:hypothetical protein